VNTYATEHPLTPANTEAAALLTELGTVIEDMNTAIAAQEGGLAEEIGAAGDRQRTAKDLRADMRDVIKTAQTLDPDTFPGVREEFRMPSSRKLAVLSAAAHGFLDKMTGPLKTAFTAHGLEADFDERIQAKVALLDSALGRKNAGLITRKGGTLGLAEKSRRGMEIVRKLDAIHRNKLRTADPVLFGVWNAAKRLEAMPVRVKPKSQVAGTATQASSPVHEGAAPSGAVTPTPVPATAA
jgi:hypothetical protein